MSATPNKYFYRADSAAIARNSRLFLSFAIARLHVRGQETEYWTSERVSSGLVSRARLCLGSGWNRKTCGMGVITAMGHSDWTGGIKTNVVTRELFVAVRLLWRLYHAGTGSPFGNKNFIKVEEIGWNCEESDHTPQSPFRVVVASNINVTGPPQFFPHPFIYSSVHSPVYLFL